MRGVGVFAAALAVASFGFHFVASDVHARAEVDSFAYVGEGQSVQLVNQLQKTLQNNLKPAAADAGAEEIYLSKVMKRN